MKKLILSIMAVAVCFFINNAAYAERSNTNLKEYSAALYPAYEPTFFTNADMDELYAQIQLLMEKQGADATLEVDIPMENCEEISRLEEMLEKSGKFYVETWYNYDEFENRVMLKVSKRID